MDNELRELKNRINLLQKEITIIKEDKKIIVLLAIVLLSNLFVPLVFKYYNI
jgi:hypothetical protein